MLIHPTVDRLRALGLAAMADTCVELQNNPEAAEMPHADWLGLLVDREVTARDNRRLTRRLTSPRMPMAERKPCSGCGRDRRMTSISVWASEPTLAASERMRSWVQSR